MPDSQKNTDTKTRPLTKEEWAALRNERNFEAIFRSIQPNWTVKIDRIRPPWCVGWCETVDFDPDEPIDLEYIRTNWGGQRFKCEVHDELGQYVTVFRVSIDAAPRRFGKLAEHPDEIERRKKREDFEREMIIRPNNAPAAPAIDPTIGKILADSIKAAGAGKDAQLSFVMDFVKKKLNAEPEGRRDMKEMLELAKSMREFADLFGMTPGEGAGSDDIWGSNAAKLLDVLDRKSKSDHRKARSAESNEQQPKGQRTIRVVKNLGSSDQGRGEVRPPVPAAADLSRTQLAASLSGMSPIDAAAVFMSALSKMNLEDREELTSILMGAYDPDDEQDDEQLDYQDDEQLDDLGDDDTETDKEAM